MKPAEDRTAAEIAEGRLHKILRAAFNMKPTPLKDIPKKTGESRKLERRKTTPARSKPA
jgi:hypothetical protein